MQVFQTSYNWGISERKSPQVSRTLLSILGYFNSAVVWMVSILLLITSSPSLFSKFLEIVARTPTLIRIIVNFIFLSFFFNFLTRFVYLSSFSRSFAFIVWSSKWPVLFFLTWIEGSVNILKFYKVLWDSFSMTASNISISNCSVYSNSSNSANPVKYKYRCCLHTVKCQNSSMLNNSV